MGEDMFDDISQKLNEIIKLTDPEDFLTRSQRMDNARKVWELARSIKSIIGDMRVATPEEMSPYRTIITPLSK